MDRSEGLDLLIRKIKLLRKKLVSYGYSNCQVNDIILGTFLDVPCHMDWYDLQNTNSMYLLRENLNLNASESELVMSLVKFFDSQKKGKFPQFFLQIIEGNLHQFGIDLSNSSSDSNQHQHYSIPAARTFQKTLSRRDYKKSNIKRSRPTPPHEDIPRKKPHLDEKKPTKRPLQDKEVVEQEKPDKKLKRQ